jgi:hypothetical protein
MADIDGGDILFTFRGDASQLQSEIELTSSSLDQVSDDADSAGGSLRGLSSITRMASAEIGRGTVAVVGLTRGIGGLKLALGPAVAAVAAVTVVVKVFQSAQEDLARIQEQSKATTESLRTTNSRLQESYEALAVATGEMTQTEYDLLQIRRQNFAESLPGMQETAAAIFEAQLNTEKLANKILTLKARQEDAGAVAGEFAGSLSMVSATTLNLIPQIEAAEEAYAASQIRLKQETVAQEENLAALELIIKNKMELVKIEVASTAATLAHAAADKVAEQASRDRAKAEADRVAGISAGVAQITADANEAAAQVEVGIGQIVNNAERAIAEVEDLVIRGQAATMAGITDSLQGVSQLSGALSEKMAEDNKKGAIVAFRVSQGAALAQVGISTAAAVMRQYADLPAPAALVSSIGIGLLGAAQAAAIASQAPPVAHIGTPAGGSMAPDERMSYGRRVLNTEMSTPGAVANSTATQTIDDANNGRLNTGGGSITATIGRSHLDTELFRSGRQGSTRFSRLLRTNPHPKPQGGW